MTTENLYRLAAFTDDPAGGNPAGVWIGDALPDDNTMQRIAKEVGFSETAFIAPATGRRRTVRYFSPQAEVPFCGHATIASGVQLGNLSGPGGYVFSTVAGDVNVLVDVRADRSEAALVSVDTRQTPIPDSRLGQYLALFGWNRGQLDDAIPPVIAYAGAWHLVIALAQRSDLAGLSYPFETLKSMMLEDDLTTIQVVWKEKDALFHSRNPFPVGGVVEDPATGAAAAALGGYLRDAGLVSSPFQFEIWQGEDMGRAGKLNIAVPNTGGVRVSGFAVPM